VGQHLEGIANMNLIKGGLPAAALVFFSLGAHAQPVPPDLNSINAASRVVIPAIGQPLNGTWGPGDASLIFRALTLMGNGWFDAIAPYHPTAVGIHSNLPRRPANEHTDYNRNVALLHASFHILNELMPAYNSTWRRMLTNAALNPNDTSTDLSTPVGIGNAAAAAIIAARVSNDGFNQYGNAGGCAHNCLAYSDYTAYSPANTPTQLNDPSRWQPLLRTSGNGVYSAQHFVTPYYGQALPYSFSDVTAYRMAAPINHTANLAAYRAQVDAVIAASAALTDEKKMRVEYFDNKYIGFTTPVRLADRLRLPLNEWVQYYLVTHMTGYDAGIATWYNKRYYDLVRPQTAVAWLYGDTLITAWGGRGRGTVNDLPARRWTSYAPTANHPDYPSGSSAFCAAFAESSRLWLGNDSLNVTKSYAIGTSVNEPGVTPSQAVTLNYATWTQWESDCKESRVNAGVHFPIAVENTWTMVYPIAAEAVTFLQAHIQGNPPATRFIKPKLRTRAQR
jgi:hypothetical protein